MVATESAMAVISAVLAAVWDAGDDASAARLAFGLAGGAAFADGLRRDL